MALKGSRTEKNILTAFAGESQARNPSLRDEKRYRALLINIDNDTVFQKNEPVVWRCRNCCFLQEDLGAPKVCPACAQPGVISNYWQRITDPPPSIFRSSNTSS
jgi:rubrerythrin